MANTPIRNISSAMSDKSPWPHILLGCSGSVATIKVPLIAQKLQQLGATVIIVPTRQALHFLKVTAPVCCDDESASDDVQKQTGNAKTPSPTNTAMSSNLHSNITYIHLKDSTKQENRTVINSINVLYCLSCAQNIKGSIPNIANLGDQTDNLSLFKMTSPLSFPSQRNNLPVNMTSQYKYSSIPSSNTPPCNNTPVPSQPRNTGSQQCIDTPPQCEWCSLQCQYPELTFAGDTLEWEMWQGRGDPVLHIDLRRWADVFVIAPLSANTLAKMAGGLCDNLLTCVARAWDVRKPLLFCPAMNTNMYEHPLTARHIATLKELRYREVPSVCKTLMCGDVGQGAMAEVGTIVRAAYAAVGIELDDTEAC